MKRRAASTVQARSVRQRRRRARRRRRPGARSRTLASISNARIGGFLGIETKFYDSLLIGAAITAPTDATGGEVDPSATLLLNTVTQGDGESQRDGRQIVMKKIMIKGNVSTAAQINQTAVDVSPVVFIALVLDTQTNGATISSEDVFVNPGGAALTAPHPFRNLQFTKRFQVLKTKTLRLPQPVAVYDGTNVETGGHVIPFSMFVNLNDIMVNFSGTTETVANIVDNSLHVIAFSSGVVTAPLLNYSSRLRFVG